MFLVNGSTTCYNPKLIHPKNGKWIFTFESIKKVSGDVVISNEFFGDYSGTIVRTVELANSYKYIVCPEISGNAISMHYLFTPVSAIAAILAGTKSRIISTSIASFVTRKESNLNNLYNLCNFVGEGLHFDKSGNVWFDSQLTNIIVPETFVTKNVSYALISNMVIGSFPLNIDRFEANERETVLYGLNS